MENIENKYLESIKLLVGNHEKQTNLGCSLSSKINVDQLCGN